MYDYSAMQVQCFKDEIGLTLNSSCDFIVCVSEIFVLFVSVSSKCLVAVFYQLKS